MRTYPVLFAAQESQPVAREALNCELGQIRFCKIVSTMYKYFTESFWTRY